MSALAPANAVRPEALPREIFFIFTGAAPTDRTGRSWLFPYMTPAEAMGRVLGALGRSGAELLAIPTEAGDVALVPARHPHSAHPLAFVSGADSAELSQALKARQS